MQSSMYRWRPFCWTLAIAGTWQVGHGNANFFYSDFSSTVGIRFNADAAQAGVRLRLTPAEYYQRGSAWIRNRQVVAEGFRCRFQFQLSDLGAVPGHTTNTGDGFAFVIQNSSPTAIGDYGSGIGYSGAGERDSIANSVAVEFDTWRNFNLDDPNQNHLSVHTRGTLPNSPHEDASLGSTVFLPDLRGGRVHTVAVHYLPGVMDLYVDDLETPILVVPVDLDATLALSQGHAWVGFTASTWNAWANHDILNVSFVVVPEPATQLMVLLGVVALPFRKRSWVS